MCLAHGSMKKGNSIKKVLFDLNHPADFHLFKHLMSWMTREGYVLKIVARDKECLRALLDNAGDIKPDREESAWFAVKAIIVSGVAMSVAGNTRPAQGPAPGMLRRKSVEIVLRQWDRRRNTS